MIDPTLLMVGGGTAIWGLWGQIKEFFVGVYTYFVVVAEFDSYPLGKAVSTYIFNTFKSSPFGVKSYDGRHFFVKSENKELAVGFEKLSKNASIFWFGFRPMWVKCSYDDKEGKDNCQISFIRGTFNLDKFFVMCLDYFNNIKKDNENRFQVHYIVGQSSKIKNGGQATPHYRNDDNNGHNANDTMKSVRYLKYKYEDLGPKDVSKLTIPLSDDYRVALNDIIQWKASESWYKDHSIPWRYGIELYGPPGTGKTSFVRSIAEKLNMPVYVFDIASLDNYELRNGWNDMIHEAPCIALIEDIDAVFHGRENITKNEDGLTFDCLLNCIEGVQSTDGLVLAITTNQLDKIDPALGQIDAYGKVTRPGRIDKIIEFGLPTREVLLKLARKVLSECPGIQEALATQGFNEQDTISQFYNRCVNIARHTYWEKKNEKNNNRR